MGYDIGGVVERLRRYSTPEKEEWTRKIVNTKMPMLVVATPKIREVAKNILKGDYISYLDSENFQYYENTIVYAKVLSKVKDFDEFSRLLYRYIPHIDNWASCDQIEFRFVKNEREKYFDLVEKLTADERTFARRIGVLILFKMLDTEETAMRAFKIVERLKNEKEYYVNMCIAWFLCEAFIKQRELTLPFLKLEGVSAWVLNKTISKCRESFRVSAEDKALLWELRQ